MKRESNQVVPSKIEDYQAILDRSATMNYTNYGLGEVSSDTHYIPDYIWNALSGANTYQKNAYIWAEDIFEGGTSVDWNQTYQRIMYANLALDIERVAQNDNNREAWNTVKGTALFHRAWNFFQLAQLFCNAYDSNTSATDLGIPLRVDYDVTIKVGRGTVKDTYERILQDLHEAEHLLPETVPVKFRPSRLAAQAMLARVYLVIGDYTQAESYATQVLQAHPSLWDYNEIDYSDRYTFVAFPYGEDNIEVIFSSEDFTTTVLTNAYLHVDTNFYGSYRKGDLRKVVYFDSLENNRIVFKGSYRGSGQLFTGLAVDEIYLTRAECNARNGKLQEALTDINQLLKKRFEEHEFVALEAEDVSSLLNVILKEREKSLCFRGLRWTDLRRLNTDEGLGGVSLVRRQLNGQLFELYTGSNKWILPLPDNEVNLNGLEQNDR